MDLVLARLVTEQFPQVGQFDLGPGLLPHLGLLAQARHHVLAEGGGFHEAGDLQQHALGRNAEFAILLGEEMQVLLVGLGAQAAEELLFLVELDQGSGSSQWGLLAGCNGPAMYGSRPSCRESNSFQRQALGPVTEGNAGMGMDLDHDAVGSHGHGCAGHGQGDVAASRGVADVDDDRKVALLLQDGDGAQVESVAGPALGRADTAFAQHDLLVALGADVLGGEEELLERGHERALEEDRTPSAADLAQELVVVHVARAHLEDVRHLGHGLHVARVDHLGHDVQAVAGRCLAQETETLEAESLEAVGGGAWLEGPSAHELEAPSGQVGGHAVKLLLALDGAGTRNDAGDGATDEGGAETDDGVLGMRCTAHQEAATLAFAVEVEGGLEDLLEEAAHGGVRKGAGVGFGEGLQHGGLASRVKGGHVHLALEGQDLLDQAASAGEARQELVVGQVDLAAQGADLFFSSGGLHRCRRFFACVAPAPSLPATATVGARGTTPAGSMRPLAAGAVDHLRAWWYPGTSTDRGTDPPCCTVPSVLVLNASYEFLNVATLARAVKLLYKGKAEIVETVSDLELGSPRHCMRVPSIIRMLYYIVRPHRDVPMSKKNVLLRDNHTCQYCGRVGDTIDHVVPRCRGGASTWENCVCACSACNARKNSRTPAEANMALLRKPRRPAQIPWLLVRKDARRVGWARYLLWNTSLDDLGEE